MDTPLPKCDSEIRDEKLKLELRLCRKRLREDAIQEAWAASLDGGCPLKAVRRFLKREQRHSQRQRKLVETAKRIYG